MISLYPLLLCESCPRLFSFHVKWRPCLSSSAWIASLSLLFSVNCVLVSSPPVWMVPFLSSYSWIVSMSLLPWSERSPCILSICVKVVLVSTLQRELRPCLFSVNCVLVSSPSVWIVSTSVLRFLPFCPFPYKVSLSHLYQGSKDKGCHMICRLLCSLQSNVFSEILELYK